MNNVLLSLQDLQKNLIAYRNTQSTKAKTQSAIKECDAKMNSREDRYICAYEEEKEACCTAGSGVAWIVSIIVAVVVAIGYTIFCIKDVQNGTDILLSPKGTVDAFEIVLAVFFGILGVCVFFGIVVGLLLPLGMLYNKSMKDRYEENHKEEKLEAQRKDQIATDKLRASMQAKKVSLLQNLSVIEQQIRNAEQKILMADFLPAMYKTEEIVAIFIKYFKQFRVTTIQEAINLYISEVEGEKRHQQILQLQRQTNAYVQSVANSAAAAAQSATNAAQSAANAAQDAASAAKSASYSGGYKGPSESEIRSAVTDAIRRA